MPTDFRCVGPRDELQRLHDHILSGESLLQEHIHGGLSGLLTAISFHTDPTRGGDCLIVDYYSRWPPPERQVFETLSRPFAEVCFDNMYVTWWTCSAGRFVVQNGRTLLDDHLPADVPKDDWLRYPAIGDLKGIGDPHTPEPWRLLAFYLYALGWGEQAGMLMEQACELAAELKEVGDGAPDA